MEMIIIKIKAKTLKVTYSTMFFY